MVTLDQIKDAQRRLRGIAARTPLVRYYPPADQGTETDFRIDGRGTLFQARESAADRLV